MSPQSPEVPSLLALRELRRAADARLLRCFAELLSLPNSCSDRQGLAATATYLESALLRRGFVVRRLELPAAPPLLYARRAAPEGGATLGLYAHYDGQPVDRSVWSYPPWRPTLLAGAPGPEHRPLPFPAPGEAVDPELRLYARSAADDKVAIAAILGACDVLDDYGPAARQGLEILLEGEEEIGSPHLSAYLESLAPDLAAEGWIVLDGAVEEDGTPRLVLGVRGYAALELTVYGPVRPLHSGSYGGWAPNPVFDLVRLLASLKDPEGRIPVPGFLDAAETLPPAPEGPFDRALREALLLPRSEGRGEPLADRILLPNLNVRGIAAGAVGPDARNEIPERAQASLDLRLVPGDDPEEQQARIEAHLRNLGYHLIRDEPSPELRRTTPKLVRCQRLPGYPATRTAPDHPLARRARRAVELASERQPRVLPTVGGSLPLYVFERILHRPVVVVPLANADSGQHGPDEFVRLGQLAYGVDLILALLAGDSEPRD